MTNTESHATVRIVLQDGVPYIESRLRAVDDAEDGAIPQGKILVLRMPLLTSGTSEAETESELIDDDGSDEAFCPECAAAGHDPRDLAYFFPPPAPWARSRKNGRNDPCPCGSGRKYKRCCLN